MTVLDRRRLAGVYTGAVDRRAPPVPVAALGASPLRLRGDLI